MKKDIRKDFPALKQKAANGQELIYFNNAATTHKPQAVIDRIVKFYADEYGTIYRGVYTASEKATSYYELAREKVAEFLNAHPEEIIFTKGTTESLNFVATAWGRENLKHGDEIVLTQMEHHANLIPWQQVVRHTGATLKFIKVKPDGTLDLSNLDKIITKKTKLVSVVHVSNVLGTHNDMIKIGKAARVVGARFLIDAAQSSPHQKLNAEELDCDFLAFSGHKMMGPTGIGILYINKRAHSEVPPYQYGGGMVFEVSFESATWLNPPQKYETGTPPIAQAIGLAEAIDYIQREVDLDELVKYEAGLTRQAIDGLSHLEKVKMAGPLDQLKESGHLITFNVEGIHAHDVSAFLDAQGIAVRAGHHCAQPLGKLLGIEASVRASFYCYNTMEEVEYFLKAMRDICEKGI